MDELQRKLAAGLASPDALDAMVSLDAMHKEKSVSRERTFEPGQGHSASKAIVVSGLLEPTNILRSRGLWSVGNRRVYDAVSANFLLIERVWTHRRFEFQVWFDMTRVVHQFSGARGSRLSPSQWLAMSSGDNKEAETMFENADIRKEYSDGKSCLYCWQLQENLLKTGIKVRLCARCRKVFYCSVACQQQHWEEHKLGCVKCVG
jgi:hypothetical protein